MAEHQLGRFRGAVFGGFERRSVIDYIEALAGERNNYSARLDDAEELCEKLRAELDDALGRERELLERNETLMAEKVREQSISEARRVRIETLDSDLQATSKKLDATVKRLEDSIDAFSDVIEAKKQAEAELSDIKNGLDSLQAAAENRARGIEQRARERSARLLENCEAVSRGLRQDYGELCEDVESIAERLRSRLTKMDARLGEIGALLEGPVARINEIEAMIERGRGEERRILGEQE